MGKTISDMHRTMYSKWRKEGMGHDEAIEKVPKNIRKIFVRDICKSPIESHFGIKPFWVFVMILTTIFEL